MRRCERLDNEPDGATRCLWGCSAIGGDHVPHNLACLLLAGFAGHRRLVSPRWAGTGHMQLELVLLPLLEGGSCVSAVWLYLAHLLFNAARHDVRAWYAAYFLASARAMVRSTLTRFPTVREHLVHAPA